MIDLSLKWIRNAGFHLQYDKLFQVEALSPAEIQLLFSICTLCLNSTNIDIQRFGYRILLLVCNKIDYFNPLYEISLNLGYIPVAQAVLKSAPTSNSSFFKEFNTAYCEQFRSDDIYRTEQQQHLLDYYRKNNAASIAVVAPTSYGKTDLILTTICDNPDSNICIITPTKALLAQTRTRIMRAKIPSVKKIIVQPEMYTGNEKSIVAVLTQERLLRLLKINKSLSFDFILVDEAHELLKNDDRSRLLASVLIISKTRNNYVKMKFLTPFIYDVANLEIRYMNFTINEFIITEYIKSEKYFIYEARSMQPTHDLVLYDQFVDRFIKTEELALNDIQFISQKSARKNIIYLNKPKDVEMFAQRMAQTQMFLEIPSLITAIRNIEEFLDPQYDLLTCLGKGIVYHHGSVPDSIRLYIEHLYVTIPEIRYVITSSTLLEGVNLPAERMFILDNNRGPSYLTSSGFKNLVGRICRFGDIFQKTPPAFNDLVPEIYLVISDYFRKGADFKKFLRDRVRIGDIETDKVQNVLLAKNEITSSEDRDILVRSQEFIENYESGTIPSYIHRKVHTAAGLSCFANNIDEIDIFNYEDLIQEELQNFTFRMEKISDTAALFEALYNIFFRLVKEDENDLIHRFSYIQTRTFYSMFLNWRVKNTPFKQMIVSFLKHWERLETDYSDTLIYVGRWGDTKRNNSHRELWTDIRTKNQRQRINLAIIRIKEEQDFFDNTILKFIEVLNDFGLLDNTFYLRIKYGTDNALKIQLVKNGISLSLANLIIDKYQTFVELSQIDDTIEMFDELTEVMRVNKENEVLIFEAEYYMKR